MQDHREVQGWFRQRHRLVEFQEVSPVGGNQAELELDSPPVGPVTHTLDDQMPGQWGHPDCGARRLLHRSRWYFSSLGVNCLALWVVLGRWWFLCTQ